MIVFFCPSMEIWKKKWGVQYTTMQMQNDIQSKLGFFMHRRDRGGGHAGAFTGIIFKEKERRPRRFVLSGLTFESPKLKGRQKSWVTVVLFYSKRFEEYYDLFLCA